MATSSGSPGFTAPVRGAGLLFAVGAVLGGAAGTVAWPLVGTVFAAVESALAGAVAGAVLGAIVRLLRRRTGSPSTMRLVGGAYAAVLAGPAALAYVGPVSLPWPVGGLLVLLAVLVIGYLAPVMAWGMQHDLAARVGHLVGRLALGGACLGALAGAVAGLVIGMSETALIAAAAVVEGAAIGTVNGGVLGLGVGGFVVLPRLAMPGRREESAAAEMAADRP